MKIKEKLNMNEHFFKMKSNAISKTEFEYITEIIPKMGLIETKTVDSTANVINKKKLLIPN